MGLRTAKNYKESLKDGREVWYEGEQVEELESHPAFSGSIQHIANLYENQHLPEIQGSITHWNEELGELVGNSYLRPKSNADIAARRALIEHWARQSNGMMGRTGDYVAAMLTAWKMNLEFFDPLYQKNISNFYDNCARNDLFLVHALVDPQIDRSTNRAGNLNESAILKCVNSDASGIYLTGVKTIATSAAIADEIIVWPLPVPQSEKEIDVAHAFSVKTNSPGLKIVCRNSFCPEHSSIYDYPLSSRFDEIDSVLFFDNVFIPWEKVFAYRDVERLKNISQTKARELTAHQTNIRLAVKIEFIYGLLNLMAESIGISHAPAIQEALGDCACQIEQLRALICASEFNSRESNGYTYPHLPPLQAGRLIGPAIYPKLIHLIKRLGAGGLMQTPSSFNQLEGPLAKFTEQYCRGALGNSTDRIKLLRLAWDLSATEFGSRHLLYELFYSGDPGRLTIAFQNEYPKDIYKSRVNDFLSA